MLEIGHFCGVFHCQCNEIDGELLVMREFPNTGAFEAPVIASSSFCTS